MLGCATELLHPRVLIRKSRTVHSFRSPASSSRRSPAPTRRVRRTAHIDSISDPNGATDSSPCNHQRSAKHFPFSCRRLTPMGTNSLAFVCPRSPSHSQPTPDGIFAILPLELPTNGSHSSARICRLQRQPPSVKG